MQAVDFDAPCSLCLSQIVAPQPGPVPKQVDRLVALGSFEGPLRNMVLCLKYVRLHWWLGWAAMQLSKALLDGQDLPSHPPVVTSIPAQIKNVRRRGFDQAEVLGRHLAGKLGVSFRPLLVSSGGGDLIGMGRSQRFAAQPMRVKGPSPASVIVVDDVMTSGSSLTRGAEALRLAGAHHVVGAVLAVTPHLNQIAARDSRRYSS